MLVFFLFSIRFLSLFLICSILFFQDKCKPADGTNKVPVQNGNANNKNSNSQKSEIKPSPFCPNGNAFYVLFYSNPLNKPQGKKIRDLRPNFVVTADTLYKNKEVLDFFHKDGQTSTGIRAISYITVDNTVGDDVKLVEPDVILAQIKDSMEAGYDGVFFDEVEDETPEKGREYYANISKAVKSFGSNKLVIFNPGEKNVEDWVFDYADIVSVENNGLNEGNKNKKNNFVKNETEFDKPFATASGKTFPNWRWLSVLGDPSEIASTSDEEATKKLNSFRKNKGLWFYSAPFMDDDQKKRMIHTGFYPIG